MAICRIFQQSSLILKLSLLENCEILRLSWHKCFEDGQNAAHSIRWKNNTNGSTARINESRVKEQLLPGELGDGSAGLLLKLRCPGFAMPPQSTRTDDRLQPDDSYQRVAA